MKWKEVKKLYPNQWVKLRILKAHEKDGYLYIDDMTVIETISNDKDATLELMRSKDGTLVFHTDNDIIRTKLIKNFGLFRRIPS